MPVYIINTTTGAAVAVPGAHPRLTKIDSDLFRVDDTLTDTTTGYIRIDPGMIVTIGDEPPAFISPVEEEEEEDEEED